MKLAGRWELMLSAATGVRAKARVSQARDGPEGGFFCAWQSLHTSEGKLLRSSVDAAAPEGTAPEGPADIRGIRGRAFLGSARGGLAELTERGALVQTRVDSEVKTSFKPIFD